MNIYLVRHGQTENNVKMILQGWNDSALTEEGIRVAKDLGEELKDVKFDRVFSSDLKRASDTARYISGKEPITTPLLREIDMGDWSGRHIDDVLKTDYEAYKIFTERADLYKKEGAEDYKTFLERIKKFFEENLLGKDYENVLLVAHGVTCVGVLALAEGLALKDFWSNRVPKNASPSILSYEDGVLRVIKKAPSQVPKEKFQQYINDRAVLKETSKDIMVILNPTSGGEDHEKMLGHLLYKLNDYYDNVYIKFTAKQFDAKEFSKKAAREKLDSVCVIGGDGTLNEVISGMIEETYKPKLMIIPGGTVNCLARVLQIPMDSKKAIDNMDMENTIKVDIGKAGKRYFSYMLSLGPVSEAIHESTSEEKTKYGPMAYFIESTKKLLGNNLKKVRVTCDDGDFEGEVDHVVVCLTNKFGKYEFSQSKLDIDDGYANVFIMTEDDMLSRLSLLGDAIWSRIEENENIKYFRTKKVRIESLEDKEICTDIDGDKGDNLPIDVEVLKKSLEVFIPRSK